jgi:pheromone shutdown protein TraB
MRQNLPGMIVFFGLWTAMTVLVMVVSPAGLLASATVGFVVAGIFCLPLAFIFGLVANLVTCWRERPHATNDPTPAILRR